MRTADQSPGHSGRYVTVVVNMKSVMVEAISYNPTMATMDSRYFDLKTRRAPSKTAWPDVHAACETGGAGATNAERGAKRLASSAASMMPRVLATQVQSQTAGVTTSTHTPTNVLPTTPPTTPPSPTMPYRRFASPVDTLSFRNAKKVATMSVLNRSPNR